MDPVFAAIAILILISVTTFTLIFADQIPLDLHSFRQTQTALTSLWFQREGFRLAYETPVGGFPWSIPFEFPIYQAIVAAISQLSGASVSLIGRLVSYSFLLLCLPVVWSITRRLALPPLVFFCFVALALTTPVYLYWGRAVMIETTALFFTVAAIKFFLDYLLDGRRLGRFALFSTFMAAALLQKITTALPVLMILLAVLAIAEIRQARSSRRIDVANWAVLLLFVAAQLAIAYAWVRYTDVVKQANLLAQSLTTAALQGWNWGTLDQRISNELWYDVIYTRVMNFNLGSWLGVAVIVGSLLFKTPLRSKVIMLAAVAAGLLPMFIFTNLHIVHDYYQAATQLFLVYALALALGAIVAPLAGGGVALILLAAMLAMNVIAFGQTGYLQAETLVFGKKDRNVAVGEILKRELPLDGQFVAFGSDWNSALAYISERKSFTVPTWFKDYDRVVARPGDFVEEGRLGAVVACSESPNTGQLLSWAQAQGGWKVGTTDDCAIAVPASAAAVTAEPGACRGSIDVAEIDTLDGRKVIRLAGWSATPDRTALAPERAVVMLMQQGKPPIYVDTLRVPRLDVNEALDQDEERDFGFSRLMPADLPPGPVVAHLVHVVQGHAILCPISRTFSMP